MMGTASPGFGRLRGNLHAGEERTLLGLGDDLAQESAHSGGPEGHAQRRRCFLAGLSTIPTATRPPAQLLG